jgi:hypothetical protein
MASGVASLSKKISIHDKTDINVTVSAWREKK